MSRPPLSNSRFRNPHPNEPPIGNMGDRVEHGGANFEQEQADLLLQFQDQLNRRTHGLPRHEADNLDRSFGVAHPRGQEGNATPDMLGDDFWNGGGDGDGNGDEQAPAGGANQNNPPGDDGGDDDGSEGGNNGEEDEEHRSAATESVQAEDLQDPTALINMQRRDLRRMEKLVKDAHNLARACAASKSTSSSKERKIPILKETDARSWRAWRLQVEDILRRNNWTPTIECMEIMCSIGGEARHAVDPIKPMVEGFLVKGPDGNIVRKKQTGTQLLDRLEWLVFIPRQQEARERMALRDLKQDNKESVTAFIKRYRVQFLRAKPHLRMLEGRTDANGKLYTIDADTDLLYGCIDGFRDPDVAHHVRSTDPKNVLELLQRAELREASLAETRDRGRIGQGFGRRPAHLQAVDADQPALQAVQGRAGRTGGFAGDCHVCGEKGHTGRNCPMMKKCQEYLDAAKKRAGARDSSKPRNKRPRTNQNNGAAAVQQVEAARQEKEAAAEAGN